MMMLYNGYSETYTVIKGVECLHCLRALDSIAITLLTTLTAETEGSLLGTVITPILTNNDLACSLIKDEEVFCARRCHDKFPCAT